SGAAAATEPDAGREAGPAAAGDAEARLTAGLEADGHAVLWDLDFRTGETALGPGPFGSLDALAAYLRARPEVRVVLVGHTDAEGALAANVDLSRRRARAARDRLVADHGIAPGRLSAEGVGYLAPIASNASPEGRERNRRVEVVKASP
ncbi:MAG: OmpA family protein, partial [Deinococcus-Thermus bacterium]|nr:OmpA family protein [Deinococcota bacterium]